MRQEELKDTLYGFLLDLRDIDCRAAKDLGLQLAIGTDAHSIEHLRYINLGVAVARRGWLEPKDVLNSLSFRDLKRRL